MLVVVAVGQDQRESVVAVSLEHVADGVDLGVTPPCGEAGVFGVGAGFRWSHGVVPALRSKDARSGIGPAEVDQVRHATKCGGLLRTDPPRAVVMKHVPKHFHVVGSALQGGTDHLLAQPAQSADRGRVPNRPQQGGLEEAGHPVVLRVSVDELHEHVVGGQHGSLGDRLDLDRQIPAVVVDDAHPVVAVEVHPLFAHEVLGLIDIFKRHRTREVVADECLEPDEHRDGVLTAAGLDVRRDVLSAWRVQRVVAVLVAVGVDDDVVELIAQGHPCPSSRSPHEWSSRADGY